jgi:hypothetical protein
MRNLSTVDKIPDHVRDDNIKRNHCLTRVVVFPNPKFAKKKNKTIYLDNATMCFSLSNNTIIIMKTSIKHLLSQEKSKKSLEVIQNHHSLQQALVSL